MRPHNGLTGVIPKGSIRWFSALACFLCLALAASPQAITLKVTAAPAAYAPMYRELVSAFERAHPDIHIDLQVTAADYDQMAQQTLLSSITGALPDVSFQGANRANLFIQGGLAAPLGRFIDKDPEWRKMHLATTPFTSGEIYSLPFGISVPTLYYNQTLLRRAGIEDLPRDWPAIFAASKRVNVLDQDLLGVFFEYTSDGNWQLVALLNSFGLPMAGADGRSLGFNSDSGERALAVLRHIGELGQCHLDMSQAQARQAFAAGRVGILIDASSNLLNFERESQGRFQLRTGSFPISSPKGKIPAAGPALLMFTKDRNRQVAAWRFMDFATSPEGQSIMARNTGYVPMNASAILDAKWLAGYYASKPNLAPVFGELSRTGQWYVFPGKNSVKISYVLRDYLEAIILLKMTPREALDGMDNKVRQLLADK